MGLLLTGIILLIAAIFVVMGAPFVYYLKRDKKWDHSNPHALTQWYS